MSTRLRRWLSRRRCLLPGTLLEQELLLEVEGLLLHLWALELWIASAAQSSEVCAQRHGGVPDWSAWPWLPPPSLDARLDNRCPHGKRPIQAAVGHLWLSR